MVVRVVNLLVVVRMVLVTVFVVAGFKTEGCLLALLAVRIGSRHGTQEGRGQNDGKNETHYYRSYKSFKEWGGGYALSGGVSWC